MRNERCIAGSVRFFDITILLYRPSAKLTPALRQQYEEIIRHPGRCEAGQCERWHHVYTIEVLADHTDPLVVRIDNLALRMDPLVIAYNKDGSWERKEFLDTEPMPNDFLAFEVFTELGERIFFEVLHFDPKQPKASTTSVLAHH